MTHQAPASSRLAFYALPAIPMAANRWQAFTAMRSPVRLRSSWSAIPVIRAGR